MPHASRDHQWDIDTHLLTPEGCLWTNLGAWRPPRTFELFPPTKDYPQACQNLAMLTGHAAGLKSGMRILELACGYGAGIDLWIKHFGVLSVDVLDIRPYCISAIQSRNPPGLGLCLTGSADDLGRFVTPQGPLVPKSYDAILCVDAAYHFGRLSEVLAAASLLLKPEAPLVWTSLLAQDQPIKKEFSLFQKYILGLAGIPLSAILSREELEAQLSPTSLTIETLITLNEEVLGGFAAHIERRSQEIGLKAKLSPAWWKIRGTAMAATHLCRTEWLHYALVAARGGLS
jgi:2-polyprenyl-3-methyl-5-hydroxy-6-metoxy-1,4-benzoquinol methylase